MKLIMKATQYAKIKCTHEEMKSLIWEGSRFDDKGGENLLYNGDKSYYKRGGIWLIVTYNSNILRDFIAKHFC